MKKSLVLVGLLLFPTTVLAQASVLVTSFESFSYPKVVVECSILGIDENVAPIFSANIDNEVYKDPRVEIFAPSGEPINVVFLVDTSESISYNFGIMQDQMAKVSSLFDKNDTLTVISFAEKVETLVQMTNNPADAGVKVGKLIAHGPKTKLYDAIIVANDLLHTKPEKGVIFLLSDGNDDGSSNDKTAPDYPVVVIPPSGGTNIKFLKKLAQETNGLFLQDFNPLHISPLVAGWKNVQGRRYKVTFENLPEKDAGSEFDFTFVTLVGQDKIESKHKVTIPSAINILWLWIILTILVLFGGLMFLLYKIRLRVPKGPKVLKKRTSSNTHYIAWISLAGSDIESYRIRKNVVIIGTNPEADFYVDDPTVSYLHAKIEEFSDGFRITDLQSVSGTFVNEKKIDSPKTLFDGDLIKIGNTTLEFTQSNFSYVARKKVI